MTFEASLLSRYLRRFTLLYLGVPVAVFFLGWLRLPLALLMIGSLAWACWQSGWQGAGGKNGDGYLLHLSLPACVFGGLLPAFVLVFLSGAGGWGSGDADWFKHDTILLDLIERPWPVTYQTSAGPVLLVYYVAFYLPAALIGKWTGSWLLAGHTLALTMFVGILLSIAWLALLGTTESPEPRADTRWWRRGAAVFFCFSGMDVLGKLGVNLFLHLPAFYGDWSDVEWWAQIFQYPSNAAALFWAPHQAIGAWLPCALLLGIRHNPPGKDSSALPLALAWLWSPFATIGLAPVLAGLLLFESRTDGSTLPQKLRRVARSPINLVAGAVIVVATAFYAARMTPFAVPAFAIVESGRSPAPLVTQGLVSRPMLYVAFVLLEFGCLAAALRGVFSTRREEKLLLAITSGILLLLPLVHYGYANDLVMRGGLPALFVLQVLAVRAFARKSTSGVTPALVAVVVILAVGAANTFLEYSRHVDRMRRDHSWRDVARDDFASRREGRPLPVQSLFELQRGIYNRPGFDFVRQYLGSTESFYNRQLAPAGQTPPQTVRE